MGIRTRVGLLAAAVAALCAIAPAAHGAALVKVDSVPGPIFDVDATRILFHKTGVTLAIMNRANRQVTDVPVASGSLTAALLTSHGAIYETYTTQTDVREVFEWRDGVTADLGAGTDLRVAGDFALWNNNAYHDDATRILYRRDLSGVGTTIPIATNVVHSGNDVAANGDVAYETNDHTVHRYRAGTDTTIGTPSRESQGERSPTTDGTNVVWGEEASSGPTESSIRGYGPAGGSGPEGPFTIDSSSGYFFPTAYDTFRAAGGWIAYTGIGASHNGIWLREPDGDETKVGEGLDPQILALGSDGDLVYAVSKEWYDRHIFIYHPGAGEQPIEVSGNPYLVNYALRGHGSFTYRANDRWYTTNWDSLYRFGPDDLQQGAKTLIDAAPSGDDTPTHATFEFSANPADPDATFQCSLDNAAFTACESPLELTALARGVHTLAVRSKDASGNYDVDPATAEWSVDSTPPDVTIDDPPARTEDTTPTLTGSAGNAEEDDTHVTVELHENNSASNSVVRTLDVTRTGGAWTAEVTPALPDGWYTATVRQSDAAGNEGTAAARTFYVDTTPPAAGFRSTSGDPILTDHPVTFEADVSYDDGEGTIVDYEWDLDGDGDFERDTGSTSHTTKTYTARGTIHPGLRLTDSVGNTAEVHEDFEVYPAPPPGQHGITINGADRFTNSPDVYVNPVWPIGVTDIFLSNDGGFGGAAEIPVARNVPWRLDSSGPERLPKTVYARFSENGTTYTDDIILDETPPVLLEAAITKVDPRVSAAAVRKRIYHLRLRARDRNAGVNRMQVTTDRKHPGPKRRYRSRVEFKSTTFKIFVRVRDRAGNWSHWKRCSH